MLNSLNTVGLKPTNNIGNIMTQKIYEEVADAISIIQQQFTLPQQMIGVVNNQSILIQKIISTHYQKGSMVKKSFDEWDKKHDDIDFKDLVSHFQYDYHPQEGKEFNNPFENLEDRYLSDDDLQKNKHRLSGYN